MNRSERVIINTLSLYLRMVVSAALLLLAARYVLAALGISDYGLYAVVGGIMGFMGFLNSAMASGSQRHLAFELGRGDTRQVGRVFSACLGIHLGVAALLVVLGETLGLWFLGNVLHIPESRRVSVAWVYQLTIVSVVANVLMVPFQAILTAHEALLTVSLLGIIQTLLFFFASVAIARLPGDHLITYALLVCAIALLAAAAQAVAALVRYPETRLGFRTLPNRRTIWEIVSFSSWNLFGALSVVARLQGIAFLLNVFFGAAVNAAYSVASQVGSQTSQVSQAMLQAVGPQVVRSEGAGDRDRVLSLALLTNKYAFLVDCFWLIPLYAELPTVLHLWLKTVPPYTAGFCRMVLLLLALEKLSAGFNTTVSAIGRIALYQAVIGMTFLSVLPMGWVAFKMGCSPLAVLQIALVIYTAAMLLRVWFVRRLTGMPFSRWVRAVLLPVAFAVLPGIAVAGILCALVHCGLLRLFLLLLTACPAVALGTLFLGMDSGERSRWFSLGRALLKKVGVTAGGAVSTQASGPAVEKSLSQP
jgi:O-antigen/teichoic acid export membrane protein